MSVAQNIKVDRAKLILALEGRLGEVEKEEKNNAQAYEKRLPVYTAGVIAALKVALEKAEKGTFPPHNYSGRMDVPIGVEKPNKPATTNWTLNLKREIALLKLGSEDVLSIRTDSNWAQYLA